MIYHTSIAYIGSSCSSLLLPHILLELEDPALISSSFDSAESLQVITHGGKWAGKDETNASCGGGSLVNTSGQNKILLIIGLKEEEDTCGLHELIEEFLGIEADAHGHWREM